MAKIKEETLKLNILINGDASRKALLDQEKAISDNIKKVKELEAQWNKLSKKPATSSNIRQMRELGAEIKQTNATLTEQKKRFAEMQKTVPLTSKTIAELKKEAAMTRIALSKAVPGTQNFKNLQQQLQETKTRLRELNDQTKATGTTLSQMAGKISGWVISAAGAVATIKTISSSVQQATDAFLEQDEAMTDAMKTTNLTKQEITGLNEELKKIDTRTSQEELLSLVRIGGKLGVSGQEDLLGFARAADQINVALKEDLGGDAEGAIAAIGKMVDIFQLKGKYGLEQSILKVGSAVNELGMASTANEGYIVEFTKRLAGIAPNANISIDRVLGLAATLDKYGQTAEMSSTAIGQTIMAMFKRTETFANIAKMSLQDFTNLLNTDVNEAFIRVLEGISQDGGGLASITQAMEEMHLSGARASQVLGTLAKNAGELRNQQQLANEAFSAGTSLTDEFAVKNNSATASVEKHKKALRDTVVTLGSELMPVTEGFMDISEVSMKLLLQVVTTVGKYKNTLIALTATIAAATLTEKAFTAAKLALGKITATVTALRRTDTAAVRANMVALKGASAGTALLSAAKFLLAGNTKMATLSMRAFNAAIAANPLGALLTALSAVTMAFTFFKEKARRAKEEEEAQAQATRKLKNSYMDARLEIEKQRSELEKLQTAAMKAKAGTAERAEAIAALNEELSEYNISLDVEKASNDDIANAMRSVNNELERRIYLTAMQKDLSGLADSFADSVKTTLGLFKEFFGEGGGDYVKSMTDAIVEYKRVAASGGDIAGAKDNMIRVVTSYAISQQPALEKKYGQSTGSLTYLEGAVKGDTTKLKGKGTELVNSMVKLITDYLVEEGEIKDLYTGLLSSTGPSTAGGSSSGGSNHSSGGSSTSGGKGSDSKWSLSSDANVQGKILAVKEKFLAGEIKTREELNKRILEIEIKALEDRIALESTAGAEELDLKQQLVEKKIQYQKDGESQTTVTVIQGEKDRLAVINDMMAQQDTAYKAARQRKEDEQAQEIADFKGKASELKALKRKHQEDLAQMDLEHLNGMKQMLQELLKTNKAVIDGQEINLGEAILSDKEYLALRKKLQDIINAMNGAGNGGAFSGTGNGELFGVSQAQWEQFFDNIKEGKFSAQDLCNVIQAIGGVANQAMAVASRAIEKTNVKEKEALKQYEKSNERKKEAVKDRLNAGLLTEEQYDAEIQRMDEEFAAKEEEMKLKQAKRNKAMDLTQAIINTALGVTMTLAQWGVPWGLIPAGIMAAMGAAEVGLIASTPVTTGAEKGGKIFTRREQDGKPFRASLSPDERGFIDSPTVLVGENGAEYVIPHEAVMNPTLAPFLATMEMARRNGQLRNIDFRSIFPATVSGRISGGFTSAAPSPAMVNVSTDNRNVIDLLDNISRKLDNPMIAQVALLGEKGLLAKMDQYKKMKHQNGTING